LLAESSTAFPCTLPCTLHLSRQSVSLVKRAACRLSLHVSWTTLQLSKPHSDGAAAGYKNTQNKSIFERITGSIVLSCRELLSRIDARGLMDASSTNSSPSILRRCRRRFRYAIRQVLAGRQHRHGRAAGAAGPLTTPRGMARNAMTDLLPALTGLGA
jgi:hypothetical protein